MSDEALKTVSGERLGVDVARAVIAQRDLRLVLPDDAPAPLEAGDVVEIVGATALRIGDIVLVPRHADCALARLVAHVDGRWVARDEPSGLTREFSAGDVIGAVSLVEKGDVVVHLRQGRWARLGRVGAALPPCAGQWLTRLALLERLQRPLFPPVFMGSADVLLARLATVYDGEAALIAREHGLTDEERIVIDRVRHAGPRLLDIGCGAGREAIGFARAGFDVTAIDLVRALLDRAAAAAASAGVTVRWAQADPLAFGAGEPPFDVVYFSRGVYEHIPGRARRRTTLEHLAGLLAPRGVIVVPLICFEAFPVLSRAWLVDLIRRALQAVGVRHVSEPGDGYHRGFALTRAPSSFRYIHRFRRPDEAAREIAAAGLVPDAWLPDAVTWIARRAAR